MTESGEKLCEERHGIINKRLDNHEERISDLEISTATNTANINNLAKSTAVLAKAAWGLAATAFMLLGGFFIWYVQSL